MDQKMTALERAFQLAKSGHVADVTEIASRLGVRDIRPTRLKGGI
jgi:hypothetical protein